VAECRYALAFPQPTGGGDRQAGEPARERLEQPIEASHLAGMPRRKVGFVPAGNVVARSWRSPRSESAWNERITVADCFMRRFPRELEFASGRSFPVRRFVPEASPPCHGHWAREFSHKIDSLDVGRR
jgi:hypothetical protein